LGIREELAKKWETPYFSQKLKSIKFNDVRIKKYVLKIIEENNE